jgi:feruloyl-CoA synthase
VTDDLLIDRLERNAEDAPQALLLPRFGLTNAEAWAQSGGVASWLIAQGFGPGALSIAVPAADSGERVVLLLGALRAGALVVETAGAAALAFALEHGRLVSPDGIAFAALAHCPVDAAVVERRLHIRADTPARVIAGVCRYHGDFVTIAEAVSA